PTFWEFRSTASGASLPLTVAQLASSVRRFRMTRSGLGKSTVQTQAPTAKRPAARSTRQTHRLIIELCQRFGPWPPRPSYDPRRAWNDCRQLENIRLAQVAVEAAPNHRD